MSQDEDRRRASFTTTVESTSQDWDIIGAGFVRFAAELPDRLLAHLSLLSHGMDGFPVDRLTHSLQSATLAYDDGRSEEYVVCALLHDIGDSLGTYNHPDIAASIIRPFVSYEHCWMVEKHGIFQTYQMLRRRGVESDLRDPLRGHKLYAHAEQFALEYDARAFDPRRKTRALTFFEPMVRRVFAGPKRS